MLTDRGIYLAASGEQEPTTREDGNQGGSRPIASGDVEKKKKGDEDAARLQAEEEIAFAALVGEKKKRNQSKKEDQT